MKFEILYVIAGDLNEFNAWHEKSKSKYSCAGFCYLSHADNLIGQKNVRGIFIGTWYERNDIGDIMNNLYLMCSDQEQKKRLDKAYYLLQRHQYGQ